MDVWGGEHDNHVVKGAIKNEINFLIRRRYHFNHCCHRIAILLSILIAPRGENRVSKIVLTKIDGITSVAQFATDFREQNGGLPGLKPRRKMS